MSDDLISRQAAIDAYLETVEPIAVQEWDGEITACARDRDILEMLENLPSVQPKTGQWVKYPDCYGCFKCSECGMPSLNRFKYCCGCGAKMEGGTE